MIGMQEGWMCRQDMQVGGDPRAKKHIAHRIGMQAGVCAGVEVRRAKICPSWESNPVRPACGLVTLLTELVLVPSNWFM